MHLTPAEAAGASIMLGLPVNLHQKLMDLLDDGERFDFDELNPNSDLEDG